MENRKFDKKEAETTGGWPCPDKCARVKLKVIAAVMNKCNITAAEYMENREEYLQKCGVVLE